jgi:lipopolysaccharide/colanic/teichoic acid biosynthesis glycosyltransferase
MSQDNYADSPLPVGAAPQHWPRLRRPRAQGRRPLQTTLLVGDAHAVAALHQELLLRPRERYRVIGCCLPTRGRTGETVRGLPVLGGPDDVVEVVHRYDASTVAVLPSSGMDGAALRRLQGELRLVRADLVLAPAGSDAMGTRGRTAPTGRGTPRQRERPGLHGVHRLVKASFDRIAATLALLVMAPALLGVAVGVKLAGRGPVFFRQERVGPDGRVFQLLRFRSAGTLRRYAIDELPQLFNVLKGDMSLVGPRPCLPSDHFGCGVGVHRRLSVKPGLIAPEQSDGGPGGWRADGGRVDVDYAENWSLRLDLTILGRTFAAVLRGEAAT